MQPRLSVVVSIHNAAEYLTECLESIAGQTLSCFEAVLVDDGSTDDSARVAEEFAARDPRFRLVRKKHTGVSAARNRGVRETPRTVDFLAFADGNDVIPHDAYDRLIASLDTTGSAFAVGNVWQLGKHGRRQEPGYHWLTESRARTHITRTPRLLADRTARNKVFRRAFWDRHALSFPEGRQYASTRVTIPAHFLAGSVDLLREHVSYQRAGQGAGAARHADAKAVRDRIAACEHISRFLAVQQPAHREAYDASCLRGDLVPFLEALPSAGRAYREAFLAAAPEFVARAAPAALDSLPAGLRVKWYLVRERRLSELLELLTSGPGDDTAFQIRGRLLRHASFPLAGAGGGRAASGTSGAGTASGSGQVQGQPGSVAHGSEEAGETVTRLARAELDGVARAREITWDGDGRIVIRGYAYIRNLEAAKPNRSVRTGVLVSVRDQGLPGIRSVPGGQGLRGVPRVRLVPTRTVPDPAATAESGQRLHCYDQAGFEMSVDPSKLRAAGRWRPGVWSLGVLIAAHGTVRHAPVRPAGAAAAQWIVRDLDDIPSAGPVSRRDAGRLRLELGWDAGGLTLSIVAHPVRVEAHHREGDDVVFAGRVFDDGVQALRLSRPEGPDGTGSGMLIEAPLTPEDGRFRLRVPLAQLATVPAPVHRAPKEVPPPCAEVWRADLVMADGGLAAPAAVPGLPPGRYALGDGRELVATADDRGLLRIELTRRPIADTVLWADDGTLTISGTASAGAGTGGGPGGGPGAEAGRDAASASGTPSGVPDAELVLRHAVLDEEVTVPLVRVPQGAAPDVLPGAVDSGSAPRETVPDGTEAEAQSETEPDPEPKASADPEPPTAGPPAPGPRELLTTGAQAPSTPPTPTPPAHGERFSATLDPGGDLLGEGHWYAYVRERAPKQTPAPGPEPDPESAPEQAPEPGTAPDAPPATGPAEYPLRVLAPLAAALPAHRTCRNRPCAVYRAQGDHLVVEAGPVLPAAERGPYARHRLRTAHYPRQREEPLREAVLYTAGRADDSLRAVHEELVRRGTDVEHLWVTRDPREQVPPAARAVPEHGSDWYEALARCRRIIASEHLPEWFERRDGQTVVQTWHGVPLKRIGADLAGSRYADHAHIEALPRLAAQWSVLVAPNRFAISRLCGALGYDGELLQAGSPRNDVLFSPDREKTAERVRTALGIEPGRRVVLYAPTYRDHYGWLDTGGPDGSAGPADSAYAQDSYRQGPSTQSPSTQSPYTQSPYTQGPYTQSPYTQGPYTKGAYAEGVHGPEHGARTGGEAVFRYGYEPAFDFHAAERALGEDHVLLVRRHPLASGRLPGARAPFVHDVTRHPHAGELLLIADVLVTDYSSLMFDFAHTGRPMLFHTYDLEHYRDTVRGFTLDFETRAPGPLLTSTDEVLTALRDLDALTERHADAYAAFRDAYCDLDDGQAAARVADRLMR
ncbi:CDP-glycerol glycerophosphotransferase family protein [Streptomyces sp. TS71-3]|uniref:CDP-glycerol glycerophosphotransferase family protein n=1 Tax=Streptomyces sp. TS71-3 TaxID=2733862 RepID=UPI001B2E8653|nr:CDP-glycerol glycerophosphotransferase family protein [Streptomyces sp. TS71-3]GHJ36442.1 hypothetical protein Sm713_20510 [Streptomyces sp. TS71-3]